jgi:hypothetical protein
MTRIKATVRSGRIEVNEPIDLPDGTELTISIPDSMTPMGLLDDERYDTPEAIDAWIRWYDAFEPVEFTPAERSARDAARHEEKQFELAEWEKRSQRIEEHFR